MLFSAEVGICQDGNWDGNGLIGYMLISIRLAIIDGLGFSIVIAISHLSILVTMTVEDFRLTFASNPRLSRAQSQLLDASHSLHINLKAQLSSIIPCGLQESVWRW